MGGVLLGLTDERRNFLLCGHLYNISLLLFRVVLGSARRMCTFSDKHKSHCLDPLENAWALAFMDHVIFGFKLAFLHSQTYVESVVDGAFGFLKECLCPVHLFLKVPSVRPTYVLIMLVLSQLTFA